MSDTSNDAPKTRAELKAEADAILKANKPEISEDDLDAVLDAMEPNESDEPSIEERFSMLAEENTGLKDKLVRSYAEMENLRKRTERELADARTYAIEKFARDLLPVSDNFARALDVLTGEAREGLSEAGQNLLTGVEATQKELHTVLARHGVTAIDAAPGAAFDPNDHQAVSQIPSEHPSGTVAQTFQSGWKIGNRTLRAAMVAVSSGPAS